MAEYLVKIAVIMIRVSVEPRIRKMRDENVEALFMSVILAACLFRDFLIHPYDNGTGLAFPVCIADLQCCERKMITIV